MTFTHADIRDRLVDYLYGQLEDEARAAFQAHVETCAACRAEVTGAERARVLAREVVRRPLADPAPEAARATAFAAARAAVAARATANSGRASVAVSVPVPREAPQAAPSAAPAPRATPASEGWVSRLRRRWTWTFPTFATVAAVAVFVLVRATIFREAKIPVSAERARELAKPEAAPAAAPGAGPPSAEGLRAQASFAVRDGEGAAAQDEPAADAVVVSPAKAPRDDRPHAQRHRAPAAGGARHRHEQAPVAETSLDSLQGEVAAKPAAPAPAGLAAPRKAADLGEQDLGEQELDKDMDRAIDDGPARARRDEQAGAAREQSVTSNAQRGSAGVTAKTVTTKTVTTKAASSRARLGAPQFAVPPPPAAAAPASSAAKGRGAPMEMKADDADTGQATPMEAQASEKKAHKKSEQPSAPASAPETPSRDRATDGGGAGASAKGMAPDPALVRGRRAESLMNQRRWPEAIAILRELLRRYPSHAAAPRWRALLTAAQAGLDAPEEMFATPPPPR